MQMKISDIRPEVYDMAAKAQERLAGRFAEIDRVTEINTRRVMEAFQNNRVAEACFAGTTGYGYDDLGRETLDKIYAEIFGTEAALVRIGFVNGTHALTAAMFALVKPGDTIVAVTGMPYDTLRSAIGISGDCHGSLKFYGINYAQVDLAADGGPDYAAIAEAAAKPNVTAVMIQRSRGYDNRKALSVDEIGRICETVKAVNPEINIMVDNCYGEFVCEKEPSHYGADVCVGSLIKNPGGGLAPTGGYIVGTQDAVERIAYRLTAPGIGQEVGSYAASYQPFYQGLFMAPHTVAQAIKTACLAARVFEILGMTTTPAADEPRADIIQAIQMRTPERLVAFCQGIQMASPIDSMALPEPWDMPGYNDQVVMAAGTFVAGASIELSADAPMREPYTAYMQGGLTYTHGRIALQMALNRMVEQGALTLK
ncbi:MAG TPA: hypothetical protein DGW67_02170 [Clostridiales bacterium]|nr:hypothetical protein [Clostridiales bacterium]